MTAIRFVQTKVPAGSIKAIFILFILRIIAWTVKLKTSAEYLFCVSG